jgi:ectoine hydroxylase-related dioxygenase (phytanoyl-CoA dioxygenase family)
MMTAERLNQLEEVGYTVLPGFLDRGVTARLRAHIDSLAPPIQPATEEGVRRLHDLRHPIPGSIMVEVLNNPELLALARELLRADDLRLLEQVLIRTDPKPPPYGPSGWHVDMAFFPRQYQATPRQTYFHMVHALSTVPPGGGAFMIVPGSHHQTYAASAKMDTAEQLRELRADPVRVAEVDVSRGIEVLPEEGDLLIFNPMALHCASGNASDRPRYVYFASFFDTTATELWEHLREINYRGPFPDSLREALPKPLHSLLEL